MSAPIRTVRDPRLSAWQSAVHDTLRREVEDARDARATQADAPVETDVLAGDPRALGTTAFALANRPAPKVVVAVDNLAGPAAALGKKLMAMKVGGDAAPAAEKAEPVAPGANQQPDPAALAAAATQVTASATDASEEEVQKQAVLSAHFYDMAESARTGHLIHALVLLWKTVFWWGIRKYSTGDLRGWITTVTQYLKTYAWGTRQPMYRDWKVEGGGNQAYGVVDWRLPKNAKIGIVGDWGTGMPDAIALLHRVLHVHKVDAVLHLGDVYYSGTRGEFRNNVQKTYRVLCPDPAVCPPFYGIPGNHCYYSRGPGFYETIDRMNGTHARRQQASFFCLRSEDDAWQFLGMDTGINDRSPLAGTPDPGVRDSEADWHLDKIANFKGSTVLLSHHQLFSSNGKVNLAAKEGTASPTNINPNLLKQFGGALGKVVAWLWGHEHNMVIYNPVATDDGRALPPGRLVGSSAYEETRFENPYGEKFPSVTFNDVRLSSENGYYSHGYSIATLGEALEIDYYEFPSSGTTEWKRYSAAPNPELGYGWLFKDTLRPAGQQPLSVEISAVTPADAQAAEAQAAAAPAPDAQAAAAGPGEPVPA